MKQLYLLLLIVCSYTVNAQTATNMVVLDTRDVDSPPSAYSREAKFEFKYRNIIGAPGIGAYSGLLTFAPWCDASGNKVHQLNFDDNELSWRTGSQQGTSWDNWNKIIVERANGNVGIGTTNPSTKLESIGAITINPTIAGNNYLLFKTNGINLGIIGSDGSISGSNVNNMGVYVYGNNNLEFWTNSTKRLVIDGSGNLGIGTQNPAYKLDVLGTIRAKEVLVNLDGGADFVFEKGYKLLPIEHVANYVQENKHLPDIPSANEMVKNGVSMGDMQVKLLQKVEELTLYAIQQNKKIETLEKEIKELKTK